MRRFVLALGLWLGLASLADAGVIHLTACDGTTLANAVTNAMSGDIIYLPAGTCIITNAPVVLNVEGKHLTILGRGIDVTNIQDNTAASHNRTFTFRTSPTTCLTFGHFTVIQGLDPAPAAGSRFAGIYGSGTSLEGPGTTCLRLTHVKRTYAIASNINLFFLGVYGVADHIEYGLADAANSNPFELEQGGMWDEEALTNVAEGDISWTQPTSVSWNGPKALYIEDSTFTASDINDGKNITDQTKCGRSVTRYNTMDRWGTTSHGTESGDRQRGSCWIGFYRNTADWGNGITGSTWIDIRAGTGVVHDNAVATGTSTLPSTSGAVFNRRGDHFSWGACDGKHHWDDNDLTAPVYTGRHTGADGATILTDSNANGGLGFPIYPNPGYIAGLNSGLNNYSVINLDQICAPPVTGHPTCVRSATNNTATTVTRSPSTNSVWFFNNNDRYELRRINWCMDQTGSGPARIYYTGGNLDPNPLLGNVRPIEPAQNAYEPVHVWNNTKNASAFNVAGGGAFHADTPPRPVFVKGSAPTGYTEWVYRCPNGQLAGTDDNGCLAKGGWFNGKQNPCTHHNGCGHPLRWVNSQLHVHGRQAIAALVPVAALEVRAVAALELRNVE